jgi:hypothetical protein
MAMTPIGAQAQHPIQQTDAPLTLLRSEQQLCPIYVALLDWNYTVDSPTSVQRIWRIEFIESNLMTRVDTAVSTTPTNPKLSRLRQPQLLGIENRMLMHLSHLQLCFPQFRLCTVHTCTRAGEQLYLLELLSRKGCRSR